ncbi:hypothetical protein Y032_0023g676 [Ancylostoma ceylanicum]|uniref:MPN domain-containing protein n=1 Tax=Ancylostoma ceylanicum TaxID=53326 RepID=A0A016UWZ4_9BILA|nr:hypothetical protein Y032_0023g676 [Ancylostoma ceylanicum]
MDGYISRNSDPEVAAKVSERMTNLLAQGKAQKVSNAVPIVRYYRSMIEVHRMAVSYLKKEDLQRALILFIRFCSFTIEELPKHVEYSQFNGEEKATVFALLKSAFEHAERVKKLLRLRFEEEAREAMKAKSYQVEQQESNSSTNDLFPAATVSHKSPDEVHPVHITDPRINTSNISYSSLNDSPNFSSANAASSSRPSAPPINRSDKPSATFGSSHDNASPIGNRTMRIAGDLIQKFLACADKNTANNVETCGTLCGTIEGDDLLVSHVILPKQTGASDGCQAEGEEDVFAYQNEHDLITLGWIHTHPSQTAFLSSVDLHTHCAYQMMLSEAIAIVCAPSHHHVIPTQPPRNPAAMLLRGGHVAFHQQLRHAAAF